MNHTVRLVWTPDVPLGFCVKAHVVTPCTEARCIKRSEEQSMTMRGSEVHVTMTGVATGYGQNTLRVTKVYRREMSKSALVQPLFFRPPTWDRGCLPNCDGALGAACATDMEVLAREHWCGAKTSLTARR